MTIPDPERPVDRPVAPQYEVREEVVDSEERRVRTVRMICSVVSYVTRLFAVVLLGHIVLVMFEANPDNPFASLVGHWASGVSLGLHNLFTPDNAKLRTLLNDGSAAILWLIIGASINFLIRRFTLPGPRRSVRYRRTVD